MQKAKLYGKMAQLTRDMGIRMDEVDKEYEGD